MKPVASPPSRHSVTVEAGLANYDTCRHKMTGRGSAFAHLSLVKNREVITAWEFGAPVGIVEHGTHCRRIGRAGDMDLPAALPHRPPPRDRKSPRLNSSH